MSGYSLNIGLQNPEALDGPTREELEQLIASLQLQFSTTLADISSPIRFRSYLAGTQTIADSTDTFLSFAIPGPGSPTLLGTQMETYDSHLIWEAGSNAVVFKTPGLYLLQGQVVWGLAAGATRTMAFTAVNGIFDNANRTTLQYQPFSIPLQVTQAQIDNGYPKIGVRVFQASGAPTTVTTSSWFSVIRIAKL